MSRTPRLYFSFRSPFSWLLVRRLDAVAPGAFERFDLHPYWEPDERTAAALAQRGAEIHYAPMSKAKHLYILQDTKRISAALGVQIRWPIDTEPWWEPAHLSWLLARREGLGRAFYDAVVSARWERGEDISDPQTVSALGDAVGLQAPALPPWEDPEIRREGVDALFAAYEDDVFGVPYMKVGWQRFWGYDRLDAFLAATGRGPVSEALAIVQPVLAVTGYDNDLPGGCG
ncbi:MAG: 2-hydroxychromene-2-carboxylate isomerase [Solirubrobacteraceae bacterium]